MEGVFNNTAPPTSSQDFYFESGVTNFPDVISLNRSFLRDDDVYTARDNPNNIISYKTFQTVEKMSHCVIIPLLFLVGAPTNLLNMAIFYRQGLRDRMNLSLFSLALVDLLFISSMFGAFSYCLFQEAEVAFSETLKWYARKYLLGFMKGFMNSSGCLTAIIAVERCACVLFPMKAAMIMKTRTMGILILATVVVNNLLTSVLGLKQSLLEIRTADGKTKLIRTASAIYEDNMPLFSFIENIVLTAITFISFIVVFVATDITVVKLKRAITWRKTTSVRSFIQDRRQVALVKMLVLVSCVYLACNTMAMSLAVVRFVEEEFRFSGQYSNLFFATHSIAMTVMQLNSSVNFFVYIAQSSRFRQEFAAMCFCFKPRRGRERCKSTSNIDVTNT